MNWTSNRKLSAETQRQALTILKKADWHDFGPAFAAEQLAKRRRIHVGKETLRGWMIEAGLWRSKVQTIEDVHVWRPRRTGFGELVQCGTLPITTGSKAAVQCVIMRVGHRPRQEELSTEGDLTTPGVLC